MDAAQFCRAALCESFGYSLTDDKAAGGRQGCLKEDELGFIEKLGMNIWESH